MKLPEARISRKVPNPGAKQLPLPEAYISHRTPQRLRVKIPSEEGDVKYFQNLGKKLLKHRVVEKFEVNSVTGSVLFIREKYVHELDVVAIAEYAEANDLFRLKLPRSTQTAMSGKITEGFASLNDKVRDMTGDQMNVPDVAFASLVGIGIFQVATGGIAAPLWHAGLWYGYNIFYHSYQQQPNNVEEKLDELTEKIDKTRPRQVGAQMETVAVQLDKVTAQLGRVTAQLNEVAAKRVGGKAGARSNNEVTALLDRTTSQLEKVAGRLETKLKKTKLKKTKLKKKEKQRKKRR
ncbi:MAG: hypothetical protein V3V45_05025 [Candidatus Brocadiales bacterium]